MTAKEKNRLAGIFLMAHGGFLGLIYLIMIAFFGLILNSDPNAPRGFFVFMAAFIAVISAVFVAPQIIGGWKMYKEHPNAKTWGIVGAIIACMNAPLGTAAGVFSLILLFSEEGNRFYNSLSTPNYLGGMNPTDDFQNQSYHQQQQKEPHNWR
jgi:hypothetical protein